MLCAVVDPKRHAHVGFSGNVLYRGPGLADVIIAGPIKIEIAKAAQIIKVLIDASTATDKSPYANPNSSSLL